MSFHILTKSIVSIIFFYLFLQLLCETSDATEAYDDYTDDDKSNFTFLITGGHRIALQKFIKYIVSIRLKGSPIFGANHICGGTILKPNTILTASHCLFNSRQLARSANEFFVVAGSTNRFVKTSNTQILNVKILIIHKGYKPGANIDDIALLILESDIKLNGEFSTTLPIPDKKPIADTSCTVVGWGRVFDKGPLPAEALHADIRILPQTICRWIFKRMHRGLICAANETDFFMNACSGDSGGPLICESQVVGIVSFGFGCGVPGAAGFYTDVWYYRDWILNNNSVSLQINRYLCVLLYLATISNYIF